MRARNQKETSHIIGNYYEIAGKGCKYTKKLQGNMSYAFQLLGISYVQIHGIAKKS